MSIFLATYLRNAKDYPMADETQHEPELPDLLDERRVKSVADFNREMTIRSWPHRMSKAAGEGTWALIDTRSSEVIHLMPLVDEAMAVHVMRAWMYGYVHDGNLTTIGAYLIGLLPDDANPY
jgi:hypothetical protein